MNNKIIKIDDVEGKVYELDNWKPEQATQVKNHFTERFKELKEAYDELIKDFNWNKIIFDITKLETSEKPSLDDIRSVPEKCDLPKFIKSFEGKNLALSTGNIES